MEETTLVVLQHGFLGYQSHMAHIERELTSITAHQSVSILNVKVNEGKYSFDGIDICGERLALAITDHVQKVAAEDNKAINRVIMIGYSLGGLIVRYAIGVLGMAGFFDTIEPLYYVSFATPHMGIHREPTTRFKRFHNYLFGNMLSRSGEQLLFLDEERILHVMADPTKPFYEYLSQFKMRRVYGNLVNDRTVPYWTAAMETAEYRDSPENTELMFDADYESIVNSMDIQKQAKKRPRSYTALARTLILTTLSPFVLPLGIVYVGTTSALSQVRAKRLLRTKFTARSHPSNAISALSMATAEPKRATRLSGASWRPMTQLLPEQMAIQSHLEKLDWERFMVYIDGLNAHGSIICRQGWLTNDGGRAVVQHLMDALII